MESALGALPGRSQSQSHNWPRRTAPTLVPRLKYTLDIGKDQGVLAVPELCKQRFRTDDIKAILRGKNNCMKVSIPAGLQDPCLAPKHTGHRMTWQVQLSHILTWVVFSRLPVCLVKRRAAKLGNTGTSRDTETRHCSRTRNALWIRLYSMFTGVCECTCAYTQVRACVCACVYACVCTRACACVKFPGLGLGLSHLTFPTTESSLLPFPPSFLQRLGDYSVPIIPLLFLWTESDQKQAFQAYNSSSQEQSLLDRNSDSKFSSRSGPQRCRDIISDLEPRLALSSTLG